MRRSSILHRFPRIAYGTILLALAFPMLTTSSVNAQEEGKTTDTADNPSTTSILEVRLTDGETLKGQLYSPRDAAIETLVIFVHGTGPATYLNKRRSGSKTYNYFDYWGTELNSRGVALFTYNKRGVTMGDQPPSYDKVDREKFRAVVPRKEVDDLAVIVDQLKADPSLRDAKVALLGASEGTVIASMCAEAYPDKIDAILLFGYAHENMYDIIAWQHSGHASMLNLNPVFDTDDNKKISKEEYESDDEKAVTYRKRVMQDVKFELLDRIKDGDLTADDFAMTLKVRHKILMHHLATGNEDWIWKHYFRISIPWLREHFALEPNKSRLIRLDLPIYIFHGDLDPNVPVDGVYDLERRFEALGKTNLTAFVFENHEHNLNFTEWRRDNEVPAGIEKILEVAAELSR